MQIQLKYGAFYMHQYKQSSRYYSVFDTIEQSVPYKSVFDSIEQSSAYKSVFDSIEQFSGYKSAFLCSGSLSPRHGASSGCG